MAALAVAHRHKVEVLRTAHPAKWHALTAAGLEPSHLASSRDTAFAAQFRAVTEGRGVDVVLTVSPHPTHRHRRSW